MRQKIRNVLLVINNYYENVLIRTITYPYALRLSLIGLNRKAKKKINEMNNQFKWIDIKNKKPEKNICARFLIIDIYGKPRAIAYMNNIAVDSFDENFNLNYEDFIEEILFWAIFPNLFLLRDKMNDVKQKLIKISEDNMKIIQQTSDEIAATEEFLTKLCFLNNAPILIEFDEYKLSLETIRQNNGRKRRLMGEFYKDGELFKRPLIELPVIHRLKIMPGLSLLIEEIYKQQISIKSNEK